MSLRWYAVAEVGAIPLNEGRKVTFGDHEAALFNAAGEFRAVENQCPHKKGPLSDGIVSGFSVFCPLHGLKIGLKDGLAATGSQCVRTYPVRVLDGKIYVAFDAPSASRSEACDSEMVLDERT